MNVERILQVANAIEQRSVDGLGFNMNYFKTHINGCGTVACIAGWACAIADEPLNSFNEAGIWLGFAETIEEADALWRLRNSILDQLFFASNHPDNINYISALATIPAEQAGRTLRHLAKTGEVDWTV